VTAPVAGDTTSPATRVGTAALTQLRLGEQDGDAARVQTLAVVAVDLVQRYLDRTVPFDAVTMPPAVIEAATTVCVELYRRKDAPFGVTGAWGQDGESFRISRDVLAGVEYLLLPYKSGWGIA